MHPRRFLGFVLTVWLAALLAACGTHTTSPTTGTGTATGNQATPTATTTPPPAWAAHLPGVDATALPAQGQQTLNLIDAGGPYPYARDGIVFGNYEGLLPKQKRGYYHEYTVPTPGRSDRGARRIVTGQDGEIYYSDDHYRTFKAVLR
jgi:ribonuclease T1